MTEQAALYSPAAEFSPKVLLLQVRRGLAYLMSRWWKILLVAIAFGIVGYVYSTRKHPVYLAEVTFALDEGATQSRPKSGLSIIQEELGLSTDAGAVFSSATNILELIQSRMLIEKTLRSKVTVNGHSLGFMDFFLDSLDYREKWMKGKKNQRMDFASLKNSPSDSLFINGLVRNMYETIKSSIIKIEGKGGGSSIVKVTAVSENEYFSKYFLEALLENVTAYYVESKTRRSKINLDFIQKRTDSIRIAYSAALYGRAAFTDANINPIRLTATVSGDRQQTDVQILRASYIELVSSLESAKTALMQDTPLIQYLDSPILPLQKTGSNPVKYFIIFFIAGVFVSAAYFTVRLIVKDIMAR